MDHALYRIYADNIPLFNGDEHILPSFIRASEELITSFQNIREPLNTINKCIISTIISKLRGHAANIICPRNELNTWALIKQTLQNTFSDGRNIDCLMNDLMSTTPNRNENLTQFGLRLQTLRSLLISKLNETNEPVNVKIVKIEYFEQITLKTYINNLPEKIQIIVKCKSPTSIEQAINYVKSEEADIEFKQRTQNKIFKPNTHVQTNRPNFIHRPTFFRPPTPNPNFMQRNQPYFGHPNMHFNNNFSHQNRTPFRPPFPNNYNNMQRTPFMPNYQNNWPRPNNTNVFKPNSNVAKFQPKPTPMDVSSGNTNLSRNQNLKTRELFTQIVENSEDHNDNPQSSETYNFYENNTYDYSDSQEQQQGVSTGPQSTYDNIDNSQFYTEYPDHTNYYQPYYQPQYPTYENPYDEYATSGNAENFHNTPDKNPNT